MAENANARATDPGAAAIGSGEDLAAKYSATRPQVYDADGVRLPERRSPIVGQPRRAVPSWHRLVADRWAEVVR